MNESKNKRLEDALKYFKLEEYAKAKKIYDEILAKDDFNVEAQCGWIKSVIEYFKFKVGCLKENEPRQKNKNVWLYVKEIFERHNNLEKLEDAKTFNQFLKGYIETIEYLKTEYKKMLDDEKKCDELSKMVAEELPPKKELSYYEKRYALLDKMLGYTSYTQNFRVKIWYGPNKQFENNWYIATGIYFLRDGSAVVPYRNVDVYKIQDEHISFIFPSTKASNLEELESILNEFITRSKQGNLKINNEKKGLFSSIIGKLKRD